jgi:hypothetical protein
MERLGQPIGVNVLHIWSIWASDMTGLLDFEATALKRINEIFQQCLPSHKRCRDVGYRVDEQFPFPKKLAAKTWGKSTQLCVQSQRSTV